METSAALVGLILCLIMVSAGCWVETRYRRTELDQCLEHYKFQRNSYNALLNVLLNRKVLERSDFGD